MNYTRLVYRQDQQMSMSYCLMIYKKKMVSFKFENESVSGWPVTR